VQDFNFFVLCRMGAGSMDYQQLSQQIELKTGAMEAGPHLAEHHSNSSLSEQVRQTDSSFFVLIFPFAP